MSTGSRSVSVGSTAADIVRGNLGELKRNLPRPGAMWKWTESPLDKSVQWRLRGTHIKEVEPGWFETSEMLWAYVIARSADDEDVGVSIGQVPLFAPKENPKDPVGGPRILSDDVSTGPEPRQLSLDGEDVTNKVKEIRKSREVSMNELGRRGGEITARKRKGEPPELLSGQLTIDTFYVDNESGKDKFSSPSDISSDGHADAEV